MIARMSDPRRSNDEPQNQPGYHRRALLTALRRFDMREAWWTLLEVWEIRRSVRWSAYGLLAAAILISVFWFWFYPRWTQRNALGMAQQWMAAGRLDYAAGAVQKSLQSDPRQPELWLLASDLALKNKQRALAVEYAHRAAQYQPGEPKYILAWASTALQAEMSEVAAEALATLPEAECARSSFAQRLLGELRRRENNFTAAAGHFDAALKIDGPGAVNEVPLGLCLLQGRVPENRQRGQDLLSRWTTDREWGAAALRLLLDDAIRHDDRPAMAKLAPALRAHPLCTFGDMPKCLLALSITDSKKFDDEINLLEKAHLGTPELAAQLIGWLNQIGQSARALAWMPSLPQDALQRPPLVQAKAEALHNLSDWNGLRDWTAQGDWGPELDFLRWTYGLHAARQLANEKRADELWNTLYSHALSNSMHAHFAGSLIYSWGLVKEAEALWWRAAGQSGGVAYESLGSLARHYQVQRDAEGQYRVFNKLHSLRPQDNDVTNNFVFFAVLTGKHEQAAEQLARDLMQRQPGNTTYLATYAYVLIAKGRAAEALKLIDPVLIRAGNSPAIRFVHGLALAGVGDKEKARPILRGLDPATLTRREVELISEILDGSR